MLPVQDEQLESECVSASWKPNSWRHFYYNILPLVVSYESDLLCRSSMLNGDKMLSLLLASRQGQDYLSQCVFWNSFMRLKPIDLENDFSVQEWSADFLVALHERVGCDVGDKFFKKPITALLLENIADRMSILNIHRLIQIYGFSKDLVFSGQPIESAKLLSSIAVRLTDTLKRDFELYGDDDVMKIRTAQALGDICNAYYHCFQSYSDIGLLSLIDLCFQKISGNLGILLAMLRPMLTPIGLINCRMRVINKTEHVDAYFANAWPMIVNELEGKQIDFQKRIEPQIRLVFDKITKGYKVYLFKVEK